MNRAIVFRPGKFAWYAEFAMFYGVAAFATAVALLVQSVFSIWGIPYGEQISATIVAINAFLGACLGISNISYQKDVAEKKEKWDEL